jgi:hypothetical protein
MSTIVDDLNTLTTKVAALRTKVKAKAVASDATVADTDTISAIVDKVVPFSKVKLTDSYTFQRSLQNYLDNLVTFSSFPSNAASYFANMPLTYINKLYTSNITVMAKMFYNCTNLQKIEELDIINCNNMYDMFNGCTKLSVMTLKNFGTQSSIDLRGYVFGKTKWGQGSDEARQSLVDSLLTYSFDRATAGYASLTVQLPSASLALLTDTKKAAIAAKGYTLTA